VGKILWKFRFLIFFPAIDCFRVSPRFRLIFTLMNSGGKMTLLVLNSMYWDWKTWKPDAYFQERAEKQIKWLEEQLQLAKSKNKRVILTSHIPPG
jgi:hypothetical protein